MVCGASCRHYTKRKSFTFEEIRTQCGHSPQCICCVVGSHKQAGNSKIEYRLKKKQTLSLIVLLLLLLLWLKRHDTHYEILKTFDYCYYYYYSQMKRIVTNGRSPHPPPPHQCFPNIQGFIRCKDFPPCDNICTLPRDSAKQETPWPHPPIHTSVMAEGRGWGGILS